VHQDLAGTERYFGCANFNPNDCKDALSDTRFCASGHVRNHWKELSIVHQDLAGTERYFGCANFNPNDCMDAFSDAQDRDHAM
jgi:uncharacterized membrane protein